MVTVIISVGAWALIFYDYRNFAYTYKTHLLFRPLKLCIDLSTPFSEILWKTNLRL